MQTANFQNEFVKLPSIKNHVIFLMAVFCFWFSTYIYIPTFGIYLEIIDLSYFSIGLILGGYGVTQILLRFPLGVFSNKVKVKKHLLMFAFLMALISSVILVFFTSFFMILLSRLLAGITASMWVVVTILYSQYFTGQQTSRAMSILQLLTVLAQFISMVICSLLIELYGWDFPFWVGAFTALLGFVLVIFIKDFSTNETINFNVTHIVKETFKLKKLKTITLLSLTAHCILFITIFGFSPIFATHIGLNETDITWLVCAFFIPHSLASLMLAFYNVKTKYYTLLLITSFGILTVTLFFLPFAETLFSLIITHAFLGLFLGIIFPVLLSEVVTISKPYLKLAAMGFYQSFYAIGIWIGPIIAGQIAEWFDISTVFFFAGGLSLVGGVLVIIIDLFVLNKRRLAESSIKVSSGT